MMSTFQPPSSQQQQDNTDNSSLLIEEAAALWKLPQFLIDNLHRDGLTHFFPVQSLVIPDILTTERCTLTRPQDVCVGAPTGSGKTLSFVLPILSVLATRKVPRLRALVVLPSRDLAQQVYEVFQRYSRGSDIQIGLSSGSGGIQSDSYHDNTTEKHPAKEHPLTTLLKNTSNNQFVTVDVLVCTPGRLIDLLDKKPGFHLQELRYLVVDEVDRLLSQPYQDWIGRVMDSYHSRDDKERVLPRRQLRKLLFSATLTNDPQKLSALRLVRPKYFDARELVRRSRNRTGDSQHNNNQQEDKSKYSMPSQLLEYTVECTAEQKPMVLLALILERLSHGSRTNNMTNNQQVVAVFTASVDATHRLARLLQLVWKSAGFGDATAIAEFSSSLNQTERSHLMKRCHSGHSNLKVIVCSDGMSRGISVDAIGTVVNYDVPNFAKTYIHRCGRTARAGREGVAVSLLKGGQVAQFHKMRQTIKDPSRIQPKGVQKELVRPAVPVYMSCLRKLAAVIAAEQEGELRPTAPIPSNMFP